jgi:hypothetical protein
MSCRKALHCAKPSRLWASRKDRKANWNSPAAAQGVRGGGVKSGVEVTEAAARYEEFRRGLLSSAAPN